MLRAAHSFYGDGPFGVLVGAVSKTHTSVASTNHRGYYIGLIPNTQTGGGGLGIWYNHLITTNSTAANAVAWNGWAGAALVLQEDYLLEFDIDVATDGISASLFALDVNGDKTGSALRSVSHTADNPLDGYFGLQGGRFGGNRVRDFRDVELSVIPEPGSLALLAASGLMLLARARRLRGR